MLRAVYLLEPRGRGPGGVVAGGEVCRGVAEVCHDTKTVRLVRTGQLQSSAGIGVLDLLGKGGRSLGGAQVTRGAVGRADVELTGRLRAVGGDLVGP